VIDQSLDRDLTDRE